MISHDQLSARTSHYSIYGGAQIVPLPYTLYKQNSCTGIRDVIANARYNSISCSAAAQELGRAACAMLQESYTMPGKKKPHHSFVIFGMNHPEDSFY